MGRKRQITLNSDWYEQINAFSEREERVIIGFSYATSLGYWKKEYGEEEEGENM